MAVLTLPGVRRFWFNIKKYLDKKISEISTDFSDQVPTKLSDLQNDSEFITLNDIPPINNGTLTIQKNGQLTCSFKANQSENTSVNIEIPTKISDLENDSNFIEPQDLSGYATKQDISDLVNYAPEALDTLKELADALGNDPDFAATLSTQIGLKANDADVVHKANYEEIPGQKAFLQDIIGNCKTADEFKTEKYISLSGDVGGVASSKGNWMIQTVLVDSGVTAGVYGQLADVLNTKSLDIKIPEITVDSKGRITNIVDRNVTATIPTKNSELTNDSGFITASSIPTKTSQLTNDSGFISGITKNMVTNALGYTPPTQDTNTTYSAGTNLNLSGTTFNLNSNISVTRVETTTLNVNGWEISIN